MCQVLFKTKLIWYKKKMQKKKKKMEDGKEKENDLLLGILAQLTKQPGRPTLAIPPLSLFTRLGPYRGGLPPTTSSASSGRG